MTFRLTNSELRNMIGVEKIKRPIMDEEVYAELGPYAKIIETVGLPKEEADWFKCLDSLVLSRDAIGKSYTLNGNNHVIRRAIAVGVSEFGTHVVDCDTGCLVYVDSTGETQVINSSVDKFLYFVAFFNKASREGYCYCETLRKTLKMIDPSPLDNCEGIWSVTLESAETGLF